MREIVVISGKGGTGKTSITAAFAHLAEKAMVCDLDVDAPDLHMLLNPVVKEEYAFRSGNEAVINQERCSGCGLCAELCRFEAVREDQGKYSVDSLRCEGCKVCVHFCPEQAVDFVQKHCGQWFASTMRFGPMIHARLFPGEENSGRLVALLKKQARMRAKALGLSLILCDGTPGIGCPVISSLSGANLAVVVTEPTPSGRHDLERVADLCRHFRIPVAVIVNKFDLNSENSREIGVYCSEQGHELLGMLPYDEHVITAMIEGRCVTEYTDSALGDELRLIWEKITAYPAYPAYPVGPLRFEPPGELP